MIVRLIVNILCVIFLTTSISAQSNLSFSRIGTGQGLSQSTVFCAFQDSRGFIWFGTAEGLNRYDGYNFKVFRHKLKDSTSLIGNDIIAINEDRDGNIWVGTRTQGISILDVRKLKFDNSINKINGTTAEIKTILKDNSNSIWFSNYGKGLFKQNNKTKKVEKTSIKYSDRVTTGFLDKSGNLWYGTSNGYLLRIISPSHAAVYKIFEPISNQFISGIAESATGKLYITTNARGLFRFEPKTNLVENVFFKNNVVDGVNSMKSIVCNDENTLFITTNDGLISIQNENIKNPLHQIAAPTKRFALTTHALMSSLIDKNQNLWIGTWEGGLNVNYKKRPDFSILRHEPGNSNGPLASKITSIAATDNTIWMGTNIGLSEFNRKEQTWKHFASEPLSGIDINSMKIDQDGDLFISAYQKNLNVYYKHLNKIKQFKNPYFNSNSSISVLANENNGKIWIGTNGNGIFLFDKYSGKFDPYLIKFNGLNINNSISAILQDSQNQLWIGTTEQGLYRLNLNSFTFKKFNNTNLNKNISNEHILSLHEDKSNRIWIGTNGNGLNLYHPENESFQVFSESDGLPNNTIKSIVEDYQGNLWISTNQGICNFNPDSKITKNYSEADGLQGKEFLRNVGTKNHEGEIFFGGSNGLSYFQPQDLIKKPNYSPKIYFTDLKLFNKTITIDEKDSPLAVDLSHLKEITLKNTQSVFTVEFLALDFQQLKNYQYAYKLEGFDDDWNYIGTQRAASYTNLHEGNYILKVKATNNIGVWSENVSSLTIKILPPWYRTFWAYGALFLMLVSSIYFWQNNFKLKERLRADIRIQTIEAQKIREIDVAKTNFFTNISHEFRTPLTLIISPLQQILQNNKGNFEVGDLHKKHNLMLHNANRLLRLINQILDISKIEAGNLKLEVSKNDIVEFLNTIGLAFIPLAQKNNINFKINISNTNRYCYFDSDVIEKITNNLLSNAFKFTPEFGNIELKAEVKNNILNLVIQDNGIGMSPETAEHVFERYFQASNGKEKKNIGTGIGLALTKELTELHFGQIQLETAPDEGSKFSIKIPVSAEKYDLLQIKEKFDFSFENDPNYIQSTKITTADINLENDAPIMLIVEDNDELREYLVGIFENTYKIIEAANGKIGLEKALDQLPDIILSDYMMPIMDGAELCEQIKSNLKTSHIPFIMLTSKQNTATITKSYEIGADDYILKPFNVNILTKKLENILKIRNTYQQKFSRSTELFAEEIVHNKTDEIFFKKAITIIENNLSDSTFDVAAFENELNMSKMQLYRKLKGVSNLSPNEFIRNIRLKKAATILKNTNFTISEVAYEVGFNDPAYFARCFRKEFGMAPTDFINRKVN